MKEQIEMKNIYDSAETGEFLEKIGAGEHRKYPSFDLGDVDFEGITRCGNCNSERIQIMSRTPDRQIRCHECGHVQWD